MACWYEERLGMSGTDRVQAAGFWARPDVPCTGLARSRLREGDLAAWYGGVLEVRDRRRG